MLSASWFGDGLSFDFVFANWKSETRGGCVNDSESADRCLLWREHLKGKRQTFAELLKAVNRC